MNIKLENSTPDTKFKKPKSFPRQFFALFIPAALQNLAVILVFFINNIFVSQLSDIGSSLKTSIGITSPILSFILLLLLGWSGGLAIMMGQYYGSREHHKNQQATVFGFLFSFVILTPFIIIALVIPKQLIGFMNGLTPSSELIPYSTVYLQTMLFSFIPFIFIEILSTGFQTTNKPIIPLYSVIINIAINVVFVPICIITTKHNPILTMILVAVVDSIGKVCQALFLLLYIVIRKYEPINFFKKHLKLEKEVIQTVLKNGMIAFLNDTLFAIFLATQAFSLMNYSSDVKQLNWITNDGTSFGNIHNSTTNVNMYLDFSNVIWPGMAAATSVLVGNYLGSGDIAKAKENARKCVLWSSIVSIALVSILFAGSWFVNDLLNSSAAKWENQLAMYMQWVMLPIILCQGIFSVTFFAIKSGGSKIIVVCDALIFGIATLINLLLTIFGVMEYLNPVIYLFTMHVDQIVRMTVFVFMFKYYHWARNLTNKQTKTIQKEIKRFAPSE